MIQYYLHIYRPRIIRVSPHIHRYLLNENSIELVKNKIDLISMELRFLLKLKGLKNDFDFEELFNIHYFYNRFIGDFILQFSIELVQIFVDNIHQVLNTPTHSPDRIFFKYPCSHSICVGQCSHGWPHALPTEAQHRFFVQTTPYS